MRKHKTDQLRLLAVNIFKIFSLRVLCIHTFVTCLSLLETNNLNIATLKVMYSEQSYKGKVNTHKYINRQNQSTTGFENMTVPRFRSSDVNFNDYNIWINKYGVYTDEKLTKGITNKNKALS